VHKQNETPLNQVMHARSGGNIEVMGLMQGKVQGDTMVVMDVFALPVEGTETRVNAQQQGYEYMVEYLRLIQKVGRLENAIGWYHSHPGYGCWLSGIDVGTQMLNQQFQEPFLAVVVRILPFSFLFFPFSSFLSIFSFYPFQHSIPSQRARALGEYQQLELSREPLKREQTGDEKKQNLESLIQEIQIEAHVAALALKGYIPFSTDLPKQNRYKEYLESRAGMRKEIIGKGFFFFFFCWAIENWELE
jgi:proteasome lid subunit RPN8/RPN11